MLTDEDIQDRIALKALFDKRKLNQETKAGFFYFEDQDLMIAQGRETYVVIPRDMAVGYPLYITGETDFFKVATALQLVRDKKGRRIDTLWDVGANIGSVCIPALARGLVSNVVAFEPEKRLFRLLRANTVLNDVDSRTACHNVAVGATRGSAELTMGQDNTGDYRIAGRSFDDDTMGEASRQTQTVDVRTMDDFVHQFDPGATLIFMDIQGYEGLALQGACQILSTAPPLVTEFWPYGMKRLESYQPLKDIVCSGIYTEFADLADKQPRFRPVTPAALDEVHATLGEAPVSFTDLLFL